MHDHQTHHQTRSQTHRQTQDQDQDPVTDRPQGQGAENTPDSRAPLRRRRRERGITTAEYAVGTAAGAGLAGLLYKMLTGGFGDRLLSTLFDHVLSLLGIG